MTTTAPTTSTPGTGICMTRLTADDHASFTELLVPPLVLLLTIVFGLIGLLLTNIYQSAIFHKTLLKSLVADVRVSDKDIVADKNVINRILKDRAFYSKFDLEVKSDMQRFFNRFRDLAVIATPAIVSTVLSIALVLMRDMMVYCFWPLRSQPYINTAISCFLMPAGFVFALSFGFMFQQAMTKQSGILDKVTEELSMLDQILTLTERFMFPDKRYAMAIYKAVKAEGIYMMTQVQNRSLGSFRHKPSEPVSIQVWSIIDILKEASLHHEYTFGVNRLLAENIISYLTQLNSICSDRVGSLHSRIHPLKWVFLLCLATFTLFGVIFLDASSPSMECAMNQITIFSTSMFCFVLADLDSPFNGFFRVDTSVLTEVLSKAERLYTTCERQLATPISRKSPVTESDITCT